MANWVGHILRRKFILKRIIEGKIEGREDEDEDVSSYLMALRKRGDIGI
jgi:hypothetical protein